MTKMAEKPHFAMVPGETEATFIDPLKALLSQVTILLANGLQQELTQRNILRVYTYGQRPGLDKPKKRLACYFAALADIEQQDNDILDATAKFPQKSK